jgi:hypothetical protein
LSSGEILLNKEAEWLFSVFFNPATGWGFSHLPKKICTLAVTIVADVTNHPLLIDW